MTDFSAVAEPETVPEPPPLYGSFPRRIQALLIDGLLLTMWLLLGATLAASLPGEIGRWANIAVLAGVLLYEPVLVSLAGGTLGHRAMNLRVVSDGSGGRLSFGGALARWVVKALLGIFSFVFMAVTSRHQALHDLMVQATVQVRDRAKASPVHFVTEREEPREAGPSSVARRVVVILVHVVALYFVMSFGFMVLASQECLLDDLCTPGEDARLFALLLASLVAAVWTAVLGWRGQLMGLRDRDEAGDPAADDLADIPPSPEERG